MTTVEAGVIERDGAIYIDSATAEQWESERHERAAKTKPRRATKPAASEPGDLRRELTIALGLEEAELAVTGAAVYGRGPQASVDLHLSDGSRITFEKFSDIAKPVILSAYIVSCVGVYRSFKGAEAGAIAAMIHKIAKHHAAADRDEAAAEWGAEFVRLAPVIELDMNSQHERWAAFNTLAAMNPARDGGEDRSSYTLAQSATVLSDRASGSRYVRSGWFHSYVKREVGGVYSPAQLAAEMERVGWQRPNTQGRIKATNPTDGRALSFRFFVVPPEWDAGLPHPDAENPDEHGKLPQVTSRAHAHTHAHAKNEVTSDNPVTAMPTTPVTPRPDERV